MTTMNQHLESAPTRNRRAAWLLIAALALTGLAMAGCDDDSYSDGDGSSACGDGELVELSGEEACVFRQELVIENGFACPMGFGNLTEFGPIGICPPEPLESSDIELIAREHRDRYPSIWSEAECVADSECDGEQTCNDARCDDPGTGGGCPDGLMEIAGPSDCLQDDAVCFETDDGTWCTGPDGNGFSCSELQAQYEAERASIQSCTEDAECGQVLTGTSCGCTRNLVARNDADTTGFYNLQGQLGAMSCDLGGGTCDCPEADGFKCEDSVCTWNYISQ